MKTYPIKCRIRAEGDGARLDILDDIGGDPWFGGGISAADVAGKLAGARGPLAVHISSQGGVVGDGLAIYNALSAYPGPVTTYVDGYALSVASVIAQAGQRRVASPVSCLMIHDAWGFADGDQAEMLRMADALGVNSGVIARAYADRAGGTVDEWRDRMRATTWYTADEALAAGLVDEVSGGSQLPAGLDLDALAARAPVRIMARLRAAAAPDAGDGGDGQKCKTCDGRGRLLHPVTGHKGVKCPSCDGTGTYDPDNDGDDDSTAAGDTDHDYVLPDGSPGPAALTEERVRAIIREEVARAAAAKVDESPWDGGKAMANGAAADDPAEFYAGICAGRKEGDPSKQASWALPYKYHPGDPPNAAGVKNALGRLPQTQGLVNEAEAKKTLQAAMKQVNPDWEPEDSTGKTVSGALLEKMRAALPALKEVRA